MGEIRRKPVDAAAGKPSPSIMEFYERELEFPADGPGRVIVRLERLMGSDKIRITDVKYMAALLQRLEEEEERTWRKRTRERRKAERNRFRQLAIDGYTDPGPEMQDLYQHPVFRVNRILNRLSKLENTSSPAHNLPPIIPIDPFQQDDSGKVFKSYPGHLSLIGGAEYDSDGDAGYRNIDNILEHIKYEDEAAGDDHDEKEDGLDVPEVIGESTDGRMMLSLQEIQKKYGVARNTDLGAQWRPYQSALVDTIFYDEERGTWDLYDTGKEVVGVYDRQQETTDDYLQAVRAGKAKDFLRKMLRRMRRWEQGEEGNDDDDEESPDEVDSDIRPSDKFEEKLKPSLDATEPSPEPHSRDSGDENQGFELPGLIKYNTYEEEYEA